MVSCDGDEGEKCRCRCKTRCRLWSQRADVEPGRRDLKVRAAEAGVGALEEEEERRSEKRMLGLASGVST